MDGGWLLGIIATEIARETTNTIVDVLAGYVRRDAEASS